MGTIRPPLVPHGDLAVQETTDEAASSKLSSSNLGYFEDKYLQYFVKKLTRRAPLINRGYYARVKGCRTMIEMFLKSYPEDVQIVSLGAGLDTSYFWTNEKRQNFVFFEVDFDDVMARKAAIILKTELLWKQLAETKEDIGTGRQWGCIDSPKLKMIMCDLRETTQLTEYLAAAGFDKNKPTLFIAECVLVYMHPGDSDKILEWASTAVDADSYIMVYEQTNPHDSFGRTMMDNLLKRGCPLLGMEKYPTIQAQKERYINKGWKDCHILDMNTVYEEIMNDHERARIQKLEIFDELEEWILIQAHYILVFAASSLSKTKSEKTDIEQHFEIIEKIAEERSKPL